jgi:transcriptional regulator with XRE-family HTH domain
MDNLSSRLKAAREAKGLSQAQLGKMAHCGQTTIASIENGRNKGSTKLAALAEILGVEPLWLAEGARPQGTAGAVPGQHAAHRVAAGGAHDAA